MSSILPWQLKHAADPPARLEHMQQCQFAAELFRKTKRVAECILDGCEKPVGTRIFCSRTA